MAHTETTSRAMLAALLGCLLTVHLAQARMVIRSLTAAGTPTTPATTPYSTKVEVAALALLKKSFVDKNNVLSSWGGADPCKYKGVFCETAQSVALQIKQSLGLPAAQKVVTGLDLNGFGLGGVINPSISSLKYLAFIHLSHNLLAGAVPNLSPLKYLVELDLSANNILGGFPPSIVTLPNLRYLDLRFCRFAGPIPAQLYQMKALDVLAINNNQLNGSVASWQTLPQTNASILVIGNNPLRGSLPYNLKPLAANLEELTLRNSLLTGTVPPSIAALASLRVLDLSKNQLKGAMPAGTASMKSLVSLNVSNNQLTQNIQDVEPLLALPTLKKLAISANYFSGTADTTTASAANLVADQNCIAGLSNQRSSVACASVGA